jgi:hypothetical protein
MKRIICGVTAAIFILLFSYKPLILFVSQHQIKKILVGAKVSWANKNFNPFAPFNYYEIEVKKEKNYYFKIKEVGLNLFSLDLTVESARYNSLNFKGASLKLRPGKLSGGLSIESVSFDKLKISDISAKFRQQDKNIFVDALSVDILGGRVTGLGNLKMDGNMEYSFNLKAEIIDIPQIIESFDLKEKFSMTGKLNSAARFSGKNIELRSLGADFTANDPGGNLTVKDTSFLKNLAKSSQQPLEIVEGSFKEYHYSSGGAKLSLEGGSLIFDASLDGEQGKRNLRLTFHDFSIKTVLGYLNTN